MAIVTPDSDASGAFEQLISMAGVGQVLMPPVPFPSGTLPTQGTLAATSGTWSSGLIYATGMRYIAVGLTMSQAGSLVITEYLDLGGTVARTASTTALVAATPVVADIGDLKPFATLNITINNTAGSAATVTNFGVILGGG